MVAQASLDNISHNQVENGLKGSQITKQVRSNSNIQLAEAEAVLHRIITGSLRWFNGEEVLDVPAREIAQCSTALVKVIERRRLNLGKANPAPAKSEPRKRGRGSIPAVRPVPEPSQEAAPRITSTDSNTLDTIPPANVTEAKPTV